MTESPETPLVGSLGVRKDKPVGYQTYLYTLSAASFQGSVLGAGHVDGRDKIGAASLA